MKSRSKHVAKSSKSGIVKGIIASLGLVIIIGTVVLVGYLAWKSFLQEDNTPKVPVKVKIEKGMTASQIGGLLQKKKVIKNSFVFRVAAKKRGVESDFKPGEYEFTTGMEYNVVIDRLIAGPPITYYDITLPEGWTAKQMAARIGPVGHINADEYLNIVEQGLLERDYPFLQNSGAKSKSLEGYLFPDTYRIKKGTTAAQFVDLQLQQFQKKTEGLDWSKAAAIGRSPYEIIIIASLVERETKVADERPIVASVIYNRLAKGMLLQIDATVQYALPEHKDRLTFDDLKVDSPYNTYKNPGLPPGPICNPGFASIQAALNPATTNYLYYVLAPDNSGRHTFTNSYDEFIKAAQQYHEAQKNKPPSKTTQPGQ
ncbi:MAG: endolytic transglycosylase MltG [Firmicutes bacterium]|nr:endolytic transglycosylase MltG [Bacillota bacterium]